MPILSRGRGPQTCYSQRRPPRLWRRLLSPGFGAAALFALSAGACSYSYNLGILSGKGDAVEHTGSVARAQDPKGEALPSDADLSFARAAIQEVLTAGTPDTSVPWENPKTGARGTVTPLAAAYTQDGFVCRDFLASYVRAGRESWMQGEACRIHRGQWQVKTLRPWART